VPGRKTLATKGNSVNETFSSKNKIVLLRLNQLESISSALASAEILAEESLGVLALEFGFGNQAVETLSGKVPRVRFGFQWIRRLPFLLRRPTFLMATFLRLAHFFIRYGRPKIVIAEGLSEQTLAFFLRLLSGVPYAAHVHDIFDEKDFRGWNRLLLQLEGACLRRSEFTIFPESARAGIYRDRYSLKLAQYVVFNCPRKSVRHQPIDWRARLSLPSDAVLMGYWGEAGPNAGIDQAIRSVARFPKLYFLLWGLSNPEVKEKYKQLASGVGAGHRVFFMGGFPDDRLSALEGLDISYCVYEPTSLRYKHFATASNRFMESLAAGVPVVTSSESDFRTLVEEHDLGSCTPDFTVNSLVATLREILQNPGRRRRQSENARRAHQSYFHYDAQFGPVLRELSNR
jgi:glycosyltransferase involved in cell wall biosynthesis